MYNLILICQVDEWKAAFVTPTGHYEYLVMPYALVNTPSVFQGFIRCSGSSYIDLCWSTKMTSFFTPGAWPNIATRCRGPEMPEKV